MHLTLPFSTSTPNNELKFKDDEDKESNKCKVPENNSEKKVNV